MLLSFMLASTVEASRSTVVHADDSAGGEGRQFIELQQYDARMRKLRNRRSGVRMRREPGRPEDAGVVPQLRRNERRVRPDERQELLMALRDAAPDDDEIRREQGLEHAVVRLQALRPRLPAEPAPH